MKLVIDPNDMTLGDIEFFEDQSGLSFDDMMASRMNTRAILALITLSERQKNPAFSMDDARKIKFVEVEVVNADDDPLAEDGEESSPE